MKIILNIILLSTLLSVTVVAGQDYNNVIIVNKEFVDRLQGISAVKRNSYLDSALNLSISGKGQIEFIGSYERYDRRYRIAIIENEFKGISILYYIFTNNKSYIYKFKKGGQITFKGRFVCYTPLNSQRDSYAFDVILDD